MDKPLQVQQGRIGRTLYVRLAPNEDLAGALQALCEAQGIGHAFVRGGVGSLVEASLLQADGRTMQVTGPAVEVLSLSGEMRQDAGGRPLAALTGMVVDPMGQVRGGLFAAGANPVFATFEVTLEEWIPDPA